MLQHWVLQRMLQRTLQRMLQRTLQRMLQRMLQHALQPVGLNGFNPLFKTTNFAVSDLSAHWS